MYMQLIQPISTRNEPEIHRRTQGASTIASFLTVFQNFLRSEGQEIKRSKRLSYVIRTTQCPVLILLRGTIHRGVQVQNYKKLVNLQLHGLRKWMV